MLDTQELADLVDSEGFLRQHEQWTPQIADSLARNENIQLNKAHWQVLNLLRQFYQEFQLAPANRPLINYLKRHLGADTVNSIYLMGLFPGASAAKIAAKIAGLPKPANCL